MSGQGENSDCEKNPGPALSATACLSREVFRLRFAGDEIDATKVEVQRQWTPSGSITNYRAVEGVEASNRHVRQIKVPKGYVLSSKKYA